MNPNSRINNSIKNFSTGFLTQMIQMLLGFVTRTVFIRYLSVEYLGVNGLFSNILMLLSIAELGVGSAIMYALYKPISDKSEAEISALLNFYKKTYIKIAIIITIIGLLFFPFLNYIIKEPSITISKDINIIYLIFLLNTVSAYFFSYKISLFHADQRSHVVSKYTVFFVVLQNVFQIVILLFFQNFIIYLLIQFFFQLGSNYYISNLVDQYYPFLKKHKNHKLDKKTEESIYANIKSTALIKIGGMAVNNTDNLILNYFSGLIMVGFFSNYVLLLGLVSGVIMQVFTSLTASVANVNAQESLEKKRTVFALINFTNFWIYAVASVLFIVLINDFITIWIGPTFILPLYVVIALVFNFYIYGMQNAVWTFKITLGFFKQGRLLVLLTAGLNILFSFVLGNQLGLLGILIATAIARFLTNIWYDPYVVFKLGLQLSFKDYVLKYIRYLFVLIVSVSSILLIINCLSFSFWILLLVKIILCLLIPHLLIYFFFRKTSEFQYIINLVHNLKNSIFNKMKI